MLKKLFLVVAAGAASPALADTTAIYSTADGEMTMTVEAASNGDVHIAMGGTMFDNMRKAVPGVEAPGVIVRDGEGYMIQPLPGETMVSRVSDVAAVLADYVASHPSSRHEGESMAQGSRLIEHGTATVNGRTGAAYYAADDKEWATPMIVVSRDPQLAELGVAMRRDFELTMQLGRAMFPGAGDAIVAAMQTGTLLEFGTMQLTEVSHDPIPAEHFVLPAEPQTREQVRAMMDHSGQKPR